MPGPAPGGPALSWWRYRSRPEASAEKSTGDTTFAQFAEQLVSGEVPLGTAWNFVTTMDGAVLVDRDLPLRAPRRRGRLDG